MDTSPHTLSTLFDQLGLPSDNKAIERFVNSHRQRKDLDPLDKAGFWNPGQANFIRQALSDDSDWAEVVDELSAQLHS